MPPIRPTRRAALLGLTAVAAAAALPLRAQAPAGTVAVLKTPGCACCEAWADSLRAAGFTVTVAEADNDALDRARIAGRVPQDLYGCHTGRLGELVIEGHVPAADILRLLAEAPDAAGLAVPGICRWDRRGWRRTGWGTPSTWCSGAATGPPRCSQTTPPRDRGRRAAASLAPPRRPPW